jgi:hypothetical protein
MSFQDAIVDYRYLKNKGYPDRAALKLVSDRYRLSGIQRNCLFRAVFPAQDCQRRRAKLIHPEGAAGKLLGVDWYNVLITVESYLKGFPVFVADDGLVRDSSGTHGSYRPGRVSSRALDEILEAAGSLRPKGLTLFLDAPISFSGQMAEQLRQLLPRAMGVPCTVELHPSADYPLKSFAGVVATSDSSIIDRDGVREVLDLPRYALERAYRVQLLTLDSLGGRLDQRS